MDIVLTVTGFILTILGILGAFLPVIPGPITGWAGLLLLYLTKPITQNWYFLGITLFVALAILILDYIIPAVGTKKFGGSKHGVYGTTIGLIIGLFFPPLGLIIGPFAGAFVGELIYDSKDTNRALKASIGAFLGFVTSTMMKFTIGIIFFVLFLIKVWDYKDVLF